MLIACRLDAQIEFIRVGPVVAIRNAASQALADVPGVGLAPGSLFTVEEVFVFLEPTEEATAAILLSAEGRPAVRLPIVSSDGFRLLARVPPDFPVGAAELLFIDNGTSNGPVAVTIKPTSFGLFTRWSTGSGPALAQNFQPGGPVQNSLAKPAAPGQFVTLWGTGLGSARDISVVVDGTPVTPTYAGPSATMPGVDQINVRIPVSGTRNLCYVPIRVKGID